MKSQSFQLKSVSDIGIINKAMSKALNVNVKGNSEKVEVCIRKELTTTESRKLVQNNLWYHWIKEYAQQKKWTHRHARGHLKYYYALPVMRASKKYNLLISMFDAKADNVGSNRDLHFAYVLPMTSQLNVTEMTEVLRETKLDIESREGVLLTDKEDMINEAMGRYRR